LALVERALLSALLPWLTSPLLDPGLSTVTGALTLTWCDEASLDADWSVLFRAGGLFLAGLLAAAAAIAAATGVVATAGDTVGRRTLVLRVFLLGFVVVRRGRVVGCAVRLVDVAVVRSRAVDRDRSVDVRLIRARFARRRLFRAVLVGGGLDLTDLLSTDAIVAPRERGARGYGERTDTPRDGEPSFVHQD